MPGLRISCEERAQLEAWISGPRSPVSSEDDEPHTPRSGHNELPPHLPTRGRVPQDPPVFTPHKFFPRHAADNALAANMSSHVPAPAAVDPSVPAKIWSTINTLRSKLHIARDTQIRMGQRIGYLKEQLAGTHAKLVDLRSQASSNDASSGEDEPHQ